MAFLLAPLKSLLFWLSEKLLMRLVDMVKNYVEEKRKKAEQEKIQKENLAKYAQAVKENKSPEEIAQHAEDLLNGVNRN